MQIRKFIRRTNTTNTSHIYRNQTHRFNKETYLLATQHFIFRKIKAHFKNLEENLFDTDYDQHENIRLKKEVHKQALLHRKSLIKGKLLKKRNQSKSCKNCNFWNNQFFFCIYNHTSGMCHMATKVCLKVSKLFCLKNSKKTL